MTKEVEDLHQGVLKFKEEYDEFCTFDNEMLIMTLSVIGLSKGLYTDPEDQKLLDDSAKVLLGIMKQTNENRENVKYA